MNNRAVSIGFCADTSLPSQEAGDGQYISTNWAHYTYDAEEHANHAVTVVGWDDNYPAENFIEGHEPKDEKIVRLPRSTCVACRRCFAGDPPVGINPYRYRIHSGRTD